MRESALLNLIDNAVQHGSPDSAITVSVSGDEAGGDVVASVHNLGVPIPDEARERIFEPFQRVASGEAAGEGDHERKGLGLESSPDGGATFSIRLSRNAANESMADRTKRSCRRRIG